MREHYHDHPNVRWHSSGTHATASERIKVAFLLNAAFTIIEFIGGVLVGSVAIIADAVHDLGDSISLGLAWYLERYSRKEKDDQFSYGYGRFSLLSAVISGVVIIAGMIYIVSEAVPRLWNPTDPHGVGMMVLAVLGIAFNGLAVVKLGKGHSHNEKILSWHLLEDVLGWLVVLIGAFFIWWQGWNWIDPLLALGLAVFIGFNSGRILLSSIKLMLQSVPAGFDPESFLKEVEEIEGVSKAHDLHVWSMDGALHILSLHIIVRRHVDWQELGNIKQRIREIVDIRGSYHTTIEAEYEHEHV